MTDEDVLIWIADAIEGNAVVFGERVKISLKTVNGPNPQFMELFNEMVKGARERRALKGLVPFERLIGGV